MSNGGVWLITRATGDLKRDRFKIQTLLALQTLLSQVQIIGVKTEI